MERGRKILKKIKSWERKDWIVAATWFFICIAAISPLAHGTPTQLTIIAAKATVFHIAVEIAFVLWVYLALSDKKYRVNWRHPVALGVGLFTLALLVTLPFSLDISESFWSSTQRFMGVYQYLHLAAWFIVAAGMVKTWTAWRNIFIAVTVVAIWGDAIAIHQWWTAPNELVRVFAFFGNPLFLAQFATLAIFIAFIIWARAKTWSLRLFALCSVLLHIFTVFLTVSRASLLALVVSIFVGILIWFSSKKNGRHRLLVPAFLFAALAVLVGIISFTAVKGEDWTREHLPYAVSRALFPTRDAADAPNFLEEHLGDRDNAWAMAIDGFVERPVFGWGIDQFRYVFDTTFDPLERDQDVVEVGFDRVHNQFLEVLVTTGVAGFIPYILMWTAIFAVLHKAFRKEHHYWQKVGILFLFMAFVAHAIQLFFLFDVRSATQTFFLLMAFTYALDRKMSLPVAKKLKPLPEFNPSLPLLVLMLLAIAPLIYFANLIPFSQFWKNNVAVRQIEQGEDQRAVDLFAESLQPENWITPWLRLTPIDMTRVLIDQLGFNTPAIQQMAAMNVEESEKSIHVSPNRFSAYHAAAISYRQAADMFSEGREGYIERGKEITEFMIQTYPGHVEGYEEYGELEILAGNYDEAIYRFEQAQARALWDDVTRGRHAFRMAEAYARKSDYNGVVDNLDFAYQSGYSVFYDVRLLEALVDVVEPDDELPPAFGFYASQLFVTQESNPYILEMVARYFNVVDDQESVDLALKRLGDVDTARAERLWWEFRNEE